MSSGSDATRVAVEAEALEQLIPSLQRRGYQVVGPVLHEGAIVYDTIKTLADLPVGWTDEQAPGRYRIKKREDAAFFGFVVGPQSWKKFLHPPEVRLFEVQRQNGHFRILDNRDPPPRYAFLGVRACEIAAISVQDRVLMEDRYADPVYRLRREKAFIVAVNCTQSAATCFCTSMQTGPRARSGFDLALTEVIAEGRHTFLVETGSAAGAEILQELEHGEAPPELCKQADAAIERTAAEMGRHMDTTNIRDLLYDNFDHPRWDDVAQRCLTCANCTMVCPTCFCTTVEDVSDLTGEHAERWRRWDSCFTQAFSYIHGGSVRATTKSRYRQWMTHKLASWIDQFGTSGCVGCGRCITWCPVGIDITEEVRAIRESDGAPAQPAAEDEHGHS